MQKVITTDCLGPALLQIWWEHARRKLDMTQTPKPPPQNLNTDDALTFQANSGADDSEDTEDPFNRGASRAGKLDMFRVPLPKQPKNTVEGGNKWPTEGGFQMTPGAKKCPEIGPGPQKLA